MPMLWFTSILVISTLVISISSITEVKGYPFGINRLWNLQKASPYSEPYAMERPILLSSRQAPSIQNIEVNEEYEDPYFVDSYSKKSQYPSGNKPLRRFNGGSRNCFFTPIQCMIQHDMTKYKNLWIQVQELRKVNT